MVTALMGVMALAIDGSYMYEERNRLAVAADAAAKAGAQELSRDPNISLSSLQAFANKEVTLNNFTPGGVVVVDVRHPPTESGGAHIGDVNYVEVLVSRQTNTFIAGVLGSLSMTPKARAVAGSGSTTYCIFSLVPLGGGGFGINIPGGSTLGSPGCAVYAKDDISISGSISASPVYVGGTCSGNCTDGDGNPVHTGASIPADPLAGLAVPTDPGSCMPKKNVVNTGATLITTAGDPITNGWRCYLGMNIDTSGGGGQANFQFAPGKYFLKGDVNFGDGTTITGSDVLIYMIGTGGGSGTAKLTVGTSANITLSAITSLPYKGVVFWQASTFTSDPTFGAGPTILFDGALYFPTANVSFGNGGQLGASSQCTVLVAQKITFNHSAFFRNGCSIDFAGSALASESAVAE